MTEEEKKTNRQLAEACMEAGRYREAAAIYRKLVKACPREESLLLALAWAYHDGGDRKKAVECFERLLEAELSRRLFTGFAYDELVRIYRENKRYDCLVRVCERAAGLQPRDEGILGELGKAYLLAGREEEAVRVFQDLLVSGSDSASLYCLLGDALAAIHKFDQADAAYQKAAELDPQAAGVLCHRLAVTYLQMGEYGQAEKIFRRCLACGEKNPFFFTGLGDSLIGQGRIREALDAYDSAVSLSSGSPDQFYHRLGNTLAAAHYNREAGEAFKKALEIDPENRIYRLRLAEALTALGRADLAAQTLDEENIPRK